MVVLSTEKYEEICDFITKFKGLTIYCEEELKKRFPDVDPHVVSAIRSREWQKHTRNTHIRISHSALELLKEYKDQIRYNPHDPSILLHIANRERFPPVSLCRILLQTEYANKHKSVVNNMLKNPNMILDLPLALNVLYCKYNDNSDGQLTDMTRRVIGEDYEVRLKKMATDAGIIFHDEEYLRLHGYDKTPDLKLAVACMYKGQVINWIESKALFGDLESHKHYIKVQLASYGNRFGSGLIIYWLGYLDTVGYCPENGDYIFVSDSFPKKEELTLCDVPYSL